jgi:hypothetical protein
MVRVKNGRKKMNFWNVVKAKKYCQALLSQSSILLDRPSRKHGILESPSFDAQSTEFVLRTT